MGENRQGRHSKERGRTVRRTACGGQEKAVESGKGKSSRKWKVESGKEEQEQKSQKKKIEEQMSGIRCQEKQGQDSMQLAVGSGQEKAVERVKAVESGKWKVERKDGKAKDKEKNKNSGKGKSSRKWKVERKSKNKRV